MKSNPVFRTLFSIALFGSSALAQTACGKSPAVGTGASAPDVTQAAAHTPASRKTNTTPIPAPLSPADIAKYHPNEAGLVPILEYHRIDNGKTTMSRKPTQFRADLERLYKEGYRPVLLSAYLDNKIDAPAGTSPVVFTFDDAYNTQYNTLPDGRVDPQCAVGIWQAFAKLHPDFPLKATFYILPRSAFGGEHERAQRIQALLALGCQVGNHTIDHIALRKLSDDKVKWELATCADEIKHYAPQANVDTVALPLGSWPKNRALLPQGEYGGHKYANRAVLMVGANPAVSPVSPRFKPMALPRIQACEGDAGITYWLDDLKRHPGRRYISDGDPTTITVPAVMSARIDKAKLNGANLRSY